MIKLSDNLKAHNLNQNLDDLALEMWKHLNYLKGKAEEVKNEKKNSLISRVDEYYQEIKNKTDDESKRQKDFFNYLKKDDNLKKIIISTPDKLLEIKKEILLILNEEDIYTIKKNKLSQTDFGKLLSEKIFSYKSFRVTTFCTEQIKKLGFKSLTCPYCNDHKVEIVESFNSEKKKAYLDLDHFYPKSQHPFFSLSFYNLVPSCHICNSLEKGDKSFCISTHINPFYTSFNDIFKFELDSNDEIKITDKMENHKFKKTLDDFNLVNRYTTP